MAFHNYSENYLQLRYILRRAREKKTNRVIHFFILKTFRSFFN